LETGVAKIDEHLGVRPGIDAGIDEFKFFSRGSLFLKEGEQYAGIGLVVAQAPTECPGITQGQNPNGVSGLGNFKFRPARAARIDMNGLVSDFCEAVLVRLELPIEGRIGLINLEVPIAVEAKN
jgi:hypothetical protein